MSEWLIIPLFFSYVLVGVFVLIVGKRLFDVYSEDDGWDGIIVAFWPMVIGTLCIAGIFISVVKLAEWIGDKLKGE